MSVAVKISIGIQRILRTLIRDSDVRALPAGDVSGGGEKRGRIRVLNLSGMCLNGTGEPANVIRSYINISAEKRVSQEVRGTRNKLPAGGMFGNKGLKSNRDQNIRHINVVKTHRGGFNSKRSGI